MTNLQPLNRYLSSTLGFERMFDVLDHASDVLNHSNTAFPPANIVRLDDYNFIVELAVAGYKKSEITISTEKNLLTIAGEKVEKDDRQYLAKGIAGRSFSRSVLLADTVVVNDATLEDGILSVYLENVIPETQKPRTITIN